MHTHRLKRNGAASDGCKLILNKYDLITAGVSWHPGELENNQHLLIASNMQTTLIYIAGLLKTTKIYRAAGGEFFGFCCLFQTKKDTHPEKSFSAFSAGFGVKKGCFHPDGWGQRVLMGAESDESDAYKRQNRTNRTRSTHMRAREGTGSTFDHCALK